MRDDTSVRLKKFADSLKHIGKAVEPFVRYLVATGTPQDVPGRIVLEHGALHVQCFGQSAEASIRSVLVESAFVAEFTFRCGGYEVWQFYLVPSGGNEFVIQRHIGDEEPLCASDDPNAAEHIIRGVAVALLTSPVLQPRAV